MAVSEAQQGNLYLIMGEGDRITGKMENVLQFDTVRLDGLIVK